MDIYTNISSFKKGNLAYQERKFNKAIEFYKTALEENSGQNFFMCNRMLGYCYYHLGEYDIALKELFYVLEHANSDLDRIYQIIGSSFKNKLDFKNAVLHYKKSLDYNSENVNCLFWLSESLFEINNFNEALEYINKVLERKKVSEAYLLKGKIYEKLNQSTDALLCYFRMTKINDKDLTAYQAMGNLLFEKKDYKTAGNYYTRCINIIPDDIFYYKRGICRKEIGNIDGYKEDIQKSAKMNNESAKEEIKQNFELYNSEKKMLIFFDTETTGLPKNWKAPISMIDNWPRLVQIAWKVYSIDGELFKSKSYIIKPENFVIPTEASNIHGITTVLANNKGEDIKKVLKKFMKHLSQSNTIIAHNLNFDENVIASELYRLNILNPFSHKEKICTMEKSTNICKIHGDYGYKWPKLQELYFYLFGKEFEEAHNAEIDINATADCFWELKSRKLI
jgi:DNA polymerase-3 subunit epsilon